MRRTIAAFVSSPFWPAVSGKQRPRHRQLGHVKRNVLGVPESLGPDLVQLFPWRGRRPVLEAPQQMGVHFRVPSTERVGDLASTPGR